MNSQTVTSPHLVASHRLRAGVELYASAQGHVLRDGESYLDVGLTEAEARELIEVLGAGLEPRSDVVQAALDQLAQRGIVDPPPIRLTVLGVGLLAQGVRSSLERMGAELRPDAPQVLCGDDHDDVADLGDSDGATVCWVDGHRVLIAPAEVSSADVMARAQAVTRHRALDPRLRPDARRRGVGSSRPCLGAAGLEFAAVQCAAELMRPEREPFELVAIDLLRLRVTRHTVLPIPPPPS